VAWVVGGWVAVGWLRVMVESARVELDGGCAMA
jgi:hypothetical protein